MFCVIWYMSYFFGGGVEDVGRWSRMWQPWRPNWWRNRPFKRRMTDWSSSWTACRPRAWWSRGRLQKRSQRKHKHTYTLTDCVRVQKWHIVTLIFIGLCYCTLTTQSFVKQSGHFTQIAKHNLLNTGTTWRSWRTPTPNCLRTTLSSKTRNREKR